MKVSFIFYCGILPSLITNPQLAYGSDERLNGGDVVVCDHSFPELRDQKTMFLDLYETENRWQRRYDLGENHLTVDEKVKLVLGRIKEIDPLTFSLLSEYQAKFWQETLLAKNLKLDDVPDSGAVQLPSTESCTIEQIAQYQEPQVPTDKHYYIRQELWDLMDKDSRAALILHELVYRHARNSGGDMGNHPNSRRSRYYISHLVSVLEWLPEDLQDYNQVMQDAKLLTYRLVDGNAISFDGLVIDNSFDVIRGKLSEGTSAFLKFKHDGVFGKNVFVNVEDGEILSFTTTSMTFSNVILKPGCRFLDRLSVKNGQLYEDSSVRSLTFYKSDLPVLIPRCYESGGTIKDISNGLVRLQLNPITD